MAPNKSFHQRKLTPTNCIWDMKKPVGQKCCSHSPYAIWNYVTGQRVWEPRIVSLLQIKKCRPCCHRCYKPMHSICCLYGENGNRSTLLWCAYTQFLSNVTDPLAVKSCELIIIKCERSNYDHMLCSHSMLRQWLFIWPQGFNFSMHRNLLSDSIKSVHIRLLLNLRAQCTLAFIHPWVNGEDFMIS